MPKSLKKDKFKMDAPTAHGVWRRGGGVFQTRSNPVNTRRYRPLGLSATLQSGRYTLSYPRGRYVDPVLVHSF